MHVCKGQWQCKSEWINSVKTYVKIAVRADHGYLDDEYLSY